MENRSVIIYGGELYHHGVKGMKWGIRRYQNPDGTLTEEGRRRLGISANRVSSTGGLSAKSRHAIAKRKNEQRFSDASTGKKVARAAIAVTTAGLGKHLTRFQYKHQVGLEKVNKAMAALGAASIVAGVLVPGVGMPAISAGISTLGSAAVGRYVNMPLNDLVYENLYSRHNKSIYKERENTYKADTARKEAKTKKEDAMAEINDKYNKKYAQVKNNYTGKQAAAKNEEITNQMMAEIDKVNKQYENEITRIKKEQYSNFYK